MARRDYFYYEVRGKRLTLYERVRSAGVNALPPNDLCKEVIMPASQVTFTGDYEKDVRDALISACHNETRTIVYQAEPLFTGPLIKGRVNPSKHVHSLEEV
ncbi:hypothetical protein HYV49_06065 [Candidatus Pacearchaeota archaeon]|nr:hypothetical protein [Candidatus Pacearchaeota archaeon]